MGMRRDKYDSNTIDKEHFRVAVRKTREIIWKRKISRRWDII